MFLEVWHWVKSKEHIKVILKGSALQYRQQPEIKRLLLLAPLFGTFLFLSSVSACLHSAQIQLQCISSRRPHLELTHPFFVNSHLLVCRNKEGLPRWQSGKEPTCQCRRHRRCRLDSWAGKIPWSRKRLLATVFLPGKFQGQRSMVG